MGKRQFITQLTVLLSKQFWITKNEDMWQNFDKGQHHWGTHPIFCNDSLNKLYSFGLIKNYFINKQKVCV